MANRSGHVRKGFTLIEATMAMVLLSVVTAAVIMPFSAGAAMNMEGAQRTIAAKLATDFLEEIQKVGFDFIETYDGLPDGGNLFYDGDWVQIFTDPVYTRYMRIPNVESVIVGGQELYWVTVQIRYDNITVLEMSRLIGP